MSKTVLIEYTRPSMYRCGDFRIIAGENIVRREIWDAVKTNPGVVKRLDSGEIVCKSPAKSETSIIADAPNPETLLGHSLKEAKAIVSKTVDYKLLKKWQDTDKRKGVLKAIELQLKEFGGVPESDVSE